MPSRSPLTLLSLALAATLAFAGLAAAQAPLPDAAAQALRQAQSKAAQALATYELHYPDEPLWREAIDLGVQAREAAPGRPEPLRFLAQAYTQTGWTARAWASWQAYQGAGGAMDAQARNAAVYVGIKLARAMHDSGNDAEATTVIQSVLALAAGDVRAQALMGEVQLGLGNPAAARPFLAAAAEADPGFQPLLTRADLGTRFGLAAADAYLAGRTLQAQGDAAGALAQYQAAVKAEPSFLDAAKAAATTAESLGRPSQAADLWRGVLKQRPADADARAGLARSEGAAKWGTRAFNAYQSGLAALAAGRPSAARAYFTQALAANGAMAPAEAELGRMALADGALDEAAARLQRALELDPTDADTRDALDTVRARQQAAASEARAQAAAAQPPAQPAPTPPAAQPPVAATPAATPAPTTPAPTTPAPATPAAATPAAAAATPATPVPAGASLLLLDSRLTHRLPSDGGSGAFTFLDVAKDLQRDLREPTNYAAGRVYVRLQVTDRPTQQPLQYQICLVPNDTITVRPACSDPSKLVVTGDATVEMSEPLSAFDGAASVNWRRGLQQVLLVLRDDQGRPLDARYTVPAATGADPGAIALDQYYPMSVRVTAMLVPAGASFPGWP